MSKKSYYKRFVDKWFDRDKSQQRARENEFYQKEAEEKVVAKPKSKPKDAPRADHKHDYNSVLIWERQKDGKIVGSVGNRCAACGKKDNKIRPFRKCDYYTPKKYYGELLHFEEDDKGNLTPIDKSKYKKTIFLGGSKTGNEISVEVNNQLVDYMNCGYDFLIGDCMGADFTMQKFLAENGYKNVTVYYSGERARVNLGGWSEKRIFANRYDLFKRKDEQMIGDCDEAFMILRDEIRGALENLERMYHAKKKCTVAIWEKHVYYIWQLNEKTGYIWLKNHLQRLNYRME